jgi:hypothetical protein
MRYYPDNELERPKKIIKAIIRKPGVLLEVRIEHLPNKSQKRYRLNHFAPYLRYILSLMLETNFHTHEKQAKLFRNQFLNLTVLGVGKNEIFCLRRTQDLLCVTRITLK